MSEKNATSQRTLDSRFATLTEDHRLLRWLFIGFAVPLVGGWLAFAFAPEHSPPRQSTSVHAPLAIQQEAAQLVPIVQSVGELIEFTVKRNDTLDRIFRQARLNLDDLVVIRNLPGMRSALDSLRPGELIAFTHVDGALQKLTRYLSDTRLLTIDRQPQGFAARIVDAPLEIRAQETHGVIDSSLFTAARAAGLSSDVIMRLANDVFGWDIDFALEIQPRDQFTVIYEKKFRDDAYLGDGQILAAEFVNEGRVYRAIRFQSSDGQIADYFTPDGKSMRKQFLRAPVEFKYVSSNFNPHRFHPILNIVRAHQGVDYSAAAGTPVRASGDGRVSHIGEQGGYGNAVVLEHGGGISTLYGHLSRFAKGLRAGSRVKQGELVGYVGMTGAATGPHLHYEYRVNGVHKNPRTIGLPDAEPIPPAYRAEFDSISSSLLSRLDAVQTLRTASQP